MVTKNIKIDASKFQYDVALSIATKLYQENVLKKPTIEELMIATSRILINEYQDNPQSVIAYFMKRINIRDDHTEKQS